MEIQKKLIEDNETNKEPIQTISKKQELLDNIRDKILRELDCPLKKEANNLVFGKGNPDAPIMFIGEAPGEKEDLEGIPFVGRAGQELDKLLRSINLTLDKIYIANILKYRPPKNRDPKIEEIKKHTPYLIEQINIIQPKIIAPLGNYAMKFVLAGFNVEGMKRIGGISFLHGKPIEKEINGITYKIVPLYHPAAMLYNPKLRETIEKDFQIMADILGIPEEKRNIKKM